ncbi:MAG: chemotaxis protein CheA [Thermodesulfobacteriota bacterium]
MDTSLSSEQIEIIQEFIQECTELLDNLEPSIISLASSAKRGDFVLDDANKAVLNEIFRLFHSIKGSSAFLGFNHLSSTAHAAENLLDQIRKGERQLAMEHEDLFCSTVDFARESLDYVSENLNDQGMQEQADELTARLRAAIANTQDAKASAPFSTPTAQEASPPPATSQEPDFQLEITPELTEKFIQEADELLQEVEQGLLSHGKNPSNREVLGDLFRHIHSFKGNCGFMGFGDLEKLSHRMETVLDVMRSGKEMGKAKPGEALLNLLDVLRQAVADLSRQGSGGIDGLDLYLDLLQEFIPPDWDGSTTRPAKPRIGEILVEQGVIDPSTLENALAIQAKPLGELLVDLGAANEAQVSNALAEQERLTRRPGGGEERTAGQTSIKRQDIRVDLEKLDLLIDLIGEMVIAENMLIHSPDLEGLTLENFGKAAQQMSKLVKELQEVAMTIRMIPVAGLFKRMTRLVHDLSRKSGKEAELLLDGMETELDKTVTEMITDPLVHLIRNSMDHGLEMPDERMQAGKPASGTIRLSARHEEGEVWITLEDDGRGLNRERILKKARERGMIDTDGSELSDREVANIIFLPGFSTADKVTDVSGRGVGMDVVKQNLMKIDGKIDVDSKPGKGTRIILRIPLTMAIIDGMLIRVGQARYILPILPIRESFRPANEAITVSPDGQELVRVRNRLYPVLRLHSLHKVTPSNQELSEGILILLENQGRHICLFVDEILGQQQTVIKGLSDYLAKLGNSTGVSGCTILGNGDVCLILDVGALVSEAMTGTNDYE